MTGRMYSEGAGIASAVLVFVGFNVTFVPQFFAGVLGMPRRYATYEPSLLGYNQVSTVGAFVLALGLGLALLGLLASLRRGALRAPANPWGAASLEWTAPSPPPHDNFATTPRAPSPYDFTGLRLVSREQGWVRAEEGR
jgi:cytochrome c oxidase subunit 1